MIPNSACSSRCAATAPMKCERGPRADPHEMRAWATRPRPTEDEARRPRSPPTVPPLTAPTRGLCRAANEIVHHRPAGGTQSGGASGHTASGRAGAAWSAPSRWGSTRAKTKFSGRLSSMGKTTVDGIDESGCAAAASRKVRMRVGACLPKMKCPPRVRYRSATVSTNRCYAAERYRPGT